MSLVRFFLPLFALGGIVLLYWVLHLTIVISGAKKIEKQNISHIDFVRVLKEEKVDKKQRIKREVPKKELVKKIPKPTKVIIKQNLKTDMKKLDLDIALIDLPLNIKTTDFLKDASVLKQTLKTTSEIIPVLRIAPRYPKRALRLKKEGYVKLKLLISKEGLVKKAEIIESKPIKIFDKAALESVYRWKFKPKQIDGKAVEHISTQTISFRLR